MFWPFCVLFWSVCFLLGHTVLNSHLLDAYVTTFCQFSFFNLSLSGFGGLFCIIVGILHLIFVQFAYLFCHLILHFSGFVSHCWWFCALFIYLLLWHFICSLWWITYVELLVFLSVLLLCVLCQSFALHDSQFVTQFDSGSFLGRILFLCGHIFRVCLQHRSIMDLCLLCLHLFMESHCVLYKS